jgi:hypothetical protein
MMGDGLSDEALARRIRRGLPAVSALKRERGSFSATYMIAVLKTIGRQSVSLLDI